MRVGGSASNGPTIELDPGECDDGCSSCNIPPFMAVRQVPESHCLHEKMTMLVTGAAVSERVDVTNAMIPCLPCLHPPLLLM
jgi:hypothetical protein